MAVLKKNLAQHVEEILRKKIMLLEFDAGDHLKESILAEELNISRGPIREAIKKLEHEGLVQTQSNGRTTVSKFDITYVRNLYKVRILLESYAIESIKPEIIEEEGSKLLTYLENMKMNIQDNTKYQEADLNFHFHIVKMSQNLTLIQSWSALKDLFITLIDVTTEATKSRNLEIINEHERVVKNILKNDLQQAKEILAQHLNGASEYYSHAVFKNY